MDERIVETMLLLPGNSFERGLVSGTSDKKVIESLEKRVGHIEMTDPRNLGNAKKGSFDVVLSFCDASSDAAQVRSALDAARPDGIVMVVMPSGYFRFPRISRVFSGSRVYGLSPSLDDLRLAVPVENRACAAASLALYQPSLKRARVRKVVAYYLARLGFAMVWARWLMFIWQKKESDTGKGLPSMLRERFGEDIELALFTGTPGYLRKSTLQIMDGSGDILGYCKVATNPQTKEVVDNEAQTLKLLLGVDLGAATVPELIFCGELPDATTVLIQSTRKKHLSSAPLVPETIHNDFLTRLFAETRTQQRFKESAAYREIADRLAAVEGFADRKLMRDLFSAFEWSARVLDDAKTPLCLAHRDFTPWNTFLAEDSLYVFDWEFARTAWIPLEDAFHFVLQKGILVEHAREDVLWQRLIEDTTQEGKFLRTHSMSIGIEGDVYYGYLAFYLVDIVTAYLLHYKDYGLTSKDGQELLNCWKAILARFVKTRGNALQEL